MMDQLPVSRLRGDDPQGLTIAKLEVQSQTRLKMNAVMAARAVFRSGSQKSDADLRAACEVLQAWGDGADWNEARMMLEALKLAPRSDRRSKRHKAFLIFAALTLIGGTIASVSGWLP
jgi:hypothetical protein